MSALSSSPPPSCSFTNTRSTACERELASCTPVAAVGRTPKPCAIIAASAAASATATSTSGNACTEPSAPESSCAFAAAEQVAARVARELEERDRHERRAARAAAARAPRRRARAPRAVDRLHRERLAEPVCPYIRTVEKLPGRAAARTSAARRPAHHMLSAASEKTRSKTNSVVHLHVAHVRVHARVVHRDEPVARGGHDVELEGVGLLAVDRPLRTHTRTAASSASAAASAAGGAGRHHSRACSAATLGEQRYSRIASSNSARYASCRALVHIPHGVARRALVR